MKLQEFFCTKDDGTYIVTLSKKESDRTDLRVECAYKALGDKRYNVKLFIGIQAYELMFEYSEKIINSIYGRLKDNIKIYILSEINESTKEKLNEFIKEKVIPKPDYFYECIGKVYKINSPSGKKYYATIYTDKVEIKEIENSKTTMFYGGYRIDEVMSIIRKSESVDNRY